MHALTTSYCMFSLTERIMPPTYAGQTWGVSELSSRQNPMFSKAKKEQQPANTCSGNLTPRFDNRSKYSNDIRAFELFRTIMKWTKNSISMMAQQMGEQNAPSPSPLESERERERAQANIRRVSQGANGTGSISWIGGAAAPDGMDVLTAETEKRVRRPQPQWEEEEEEDYKQ